MIVLYRLLIMSLLAIVFYPAYSQDDKFKTHEELDREFTENLKALKHSFSFSLHYGRAQMFSSAVSDSISLVNISNYHKQWNLTFEYYPWENTAFQFSSGLQYIPKEKRIDSLSWTPGAGLGGIRAKAHGKGGAVIPVSLGIKKSFLHGLTRPYFSGGLGLSYITVGVGTASVIDGHTNKDINRQSQVTFSWKVGTGIQHRMGKVVRLNLGVDFFGSPRLSPVIGSMDRLSGWYLSAGLNFILNPDRKNH